LAAENRILSRVARSGFVHRGTPWLRLQPRTQPGGEVGFGQGAFRERKHLYVLFLVAGAELHAIEGQEHPIADVRRALVAVHERMIAGEAESEAGGQVREVRRRVAIRVQLLRAGKGRFEHSLVADAASAAMLRQLPLMDGKRERTRDPGNHRPTPPASAAPPDPCAWPPRPL